MPQVSLYFYTLVFFKKSDKKNILDVLGKILCVYFLIYRLYFFILILLYFGIF